MAQRESTTIEYSVFDVENPLEGETPERIEEFCDRYVFLEAKKSLKIRDGKRVRYKELMRRDDDNLDTFLNMNFHNDPEKDPLASFLQYHDLESAMHDNSLVVSKKRKLYRREGVNIYYGEFTVKGEQHTVLTLTATNEERIKKVKEELELRESNLNFSEYLMRYAPIPQ